MSSSIQPCPCTDRSPSALELPSTRSAEPGGPSAQVRPSRSLVWALWDSVDRPEWVYSRGFWLEGFSSACSCSYIPTESTQLYRGAPADRSHGMAWTPNLGQAIAYARGRFDPARCDPTAWEPGFLFATLVSPDAILHLHDGRTKQDGWSEGDKTVIVNPELLGDVTIHWGEFYPSPTPRSL